MLSIAVLAGGLATRLRPITEKIPKSLIAINDIPFVIYQLSLFQQNGINHVHFCLGHLGEMVEKVVDESKFSKMMKITYSFDGDKLLGTGGAIKKALPFLPDTFFVTYGDSYLDIDYQSIKSRFFESIYEDCGLMTVYKNSNQYDTSNVIFENSRIILYSKKQLTDNMNYIDYGLGILRKSHFNAYPNETPFDLSDIYEKLAINGELIGYEAHERFYEIGSVKGIEDLSIYIKNKKIMSSYSKQHLAEAGKIMEQIDDSMIEKMVNIIATTRENNGRLFFLGVGGSAGNASHAVNDFRKIVGIESYAPTDNVSELTARTNDEGWDTIFYEWLKTSKLNNNDALFILSVGGGNIEKNISPNLVKALQLAKERGSKIVGIVGRDGGYTAKVADAAVIVPTVNPETVTPHSEAFQAVIWHLLVSHPVLKAKQTKWESTQK